MGYGVSRDDKLNSPSLTQPARASTMPAMTTGMVWQWRPTASAWEAARPFLPRHSRYTILATSHTHFFCLDVKASYPVIVLSSLAPALRGRVACFLVPFVSHIHDGKLTDFTNTVNRNL